MSVSVIDTAEGAWVGIGHKDPLVDAHPTSKNVKIDKFKLPHRFIVSFLLNSYICKLMVSPKISTA